MIQNLVDVVLGMAKESIKTFSQESFNQTVRLINGFSALVLAVLPFQSSLEGIQGWELRPRLRAPRFLSWMENGVSSFNSFIHDYESDEDLYYESGSESEYEDSLAPSSPSSTTSFVSRASSFGRHRRHGGLWKKLLRILFWPFRIWEATVAPTPRVVRELLRSSSSGSLQRMLRSSSSGSMQRMYRGMKDYMMPKQSGDRRRGVIEDMQFWAELLIERFFETVQTLIHYFLSPFSTLKLFITWLFFSNFDGELDDLVVTSTLGDSNPAIQMQARRQQTLNTDERTCEDVITALGYPYEALRVTTEDGYILLLERIPRPSAQKVLYLQHGMLDSSLGWVSNGVVGSQAFAAYDQGYDVFLGNFRGLASREHVNPNLSARSYWHFSVNEHCTQDIPAMLTRIHHIKTSDLQQDADRPHSHSSSPPRSLPYSICGVAHSLGGASILMYVITRRLEEKPHYLSRLVLLSPAGFHQDAPLFCWLMTYVFPVLSPLLQPLLPGLYIPTRFFRGLFNKLARDFQNYPAVGGLVQTLVSSVVGGDASNWVGVIGVSHYNMNDMPGLSFLVAQHLAQMMRKKRFTMFDFGSAEANVAAYGTVEPLDIAAHYHFVDIPVDLVAGRKDMVIPRSMVKRHYQTLKQAGCKVSYDEFDYAHLDFTFSHKEELQDYVMSRLLLVKPPRRNVEKIERPVSNNMQSANAPGTKKSFRKPRIVVNAEEEVPLGETTGAGSGSSRSKRSRSRGERETESSNLQTQLEGPRLQSKKDLDVYPGLSMVTAGSVATPSHEESMQEAEEVVQEPFDDSSFFAFPSKEVVSIMSQRVSRRGVRSTDVVKHDFDVSGSALK